MAPKSLKDSLSGGKKSHGTSSKISIPTPEVIAARLDNPPRKSQCLVAQILVQSGIRDPESLSYSSVSMR